MVCKGICIKYKVSKPNAPLGHYQVGHKRCQICEIFIKWKGKSCPCCNYRLRATPRNAVYKAKLRKTLKENKGKHIDHIEPSIKISQNIGYCNPAEIKVQRKFQELLPRPSKKEYEQMKYSIKKDGQEKPITVDTKMGLVDGHTRLKICKELKKNVYYEIKTFPDKESVLKFMAIVNLHRRNLSQFQKVLLYKELYLLERFKAHDRILQGVKRSNLLRKGIKSVRVEDGGLARKKYAEIIGVSEDAVHKSFYIQKFGGKKINKEVDDQTMTVSEGYWRTREKKQREKIVEKVHTYMITIHPSEGSMWKIQRKFTSRQIDALKDHIRKFNVGKTN